MKFTFTFGCEYRDAITGFTGYCIGQAQYITGCDQILLSRPGKKGDEGKSVWFDAGRLVKESGKPIELPAHASRENGADIPAPVK